jgi:hypothetical protein
MSAGTTQQQRFPPALAPGWFAVDEWRLDQRLAMCVRYASALRFIDSDGRASGHWGEMFERDEAALLADIASLDLARIESSFIDEFDAAPPARLRRQALALAGRFERWHRTLAELADAGQLTARAMALRIAQTAAALSGEVVALHGLQGDTRGNAAAPALTPIWQPTGASAPRSTRPPREQLRSSFFALLHALSELQRLARALLPQSLRSQAHAPAPALLIAMLQVHGRVQQHVNRLVERRIDFYYRDCLRLAPRPAEPDHLHLVLRGDPARGRGVCVPAGTRFVTGKDGAGHSAEYGADTALHVADVRVATLLTLRRERDALISPECAFGFVTRVKASHLPLADGAGPGSRPAAAWPLFGGTVSGAGAGVAEDGRIGLAVGSPHLWLQEGEREIRLTLEFAFAADEQRALLQRVCAAETAPAFSAAAGRLLVHWLFDPQDRLTDADLAALRAAARRHLETPAETPADGDPLALLWGAGRPRRELMLDQLCQGLVDARLSTAAGWHAVDDLTVLRAPPSPEGGAGGLTLVLRLPVGAPPVVGCRPEVHGGQAPAGLPQLQVLQGRRARVCPLSLFDRVGLSALSLQVQVRGLRDLSVHNQLGRLDPSKPFTPFGPLPTTASYLVVGAPELARKRIDRLTLNFRWSGLPAGSGGFEHHYAGYGNGFGNRDFSASTAVLRDGRWDATGDTGSLLFAEDPHGRLRPESTLPVDPALLHARWRVGDPSLGYEQGARHAFVKLQLAGPAQAFGHQRYPGLLTAAVSANARRRRGHPLTLPQPPYTPLVERLSLDYSAHCHLRLGDGAADELGEERVWHLRPFGQQQIHPGPAGRLPTLLPDLDDDGQLIIGLSVAAPGGALSLLFELSEDTAIERLVRAGPRPSVAWAVLIDDAWQPLAPAQVLADSTAGLLRSGVITLDLPADLGRDHQTLPAGLVWLRLSTNAGSGRFAGLRAVHAQALRATRCADSADPGAPLPAGKVIAPARSIAGLKAVLQPAASSGARAAEDEQGFRTRVGERLRHKHRASLPWDFERLVLERFPEVWKVRCVNHRSAGVGAGRSGDIREPGRVVIVVVPTTPRNDPANATQAARLNAAALEAIEQALRALASPLARITVRNPSYERAQLRCAVRLAPGTPPGQAVQRITQAVGAYLSPWHDTGYGARFDWLVRGEDLEACIRALPEVRSVGRVSLLHFGEDEHGRHWLADSARRAGGVASLRSRTPWSLVLPAERHIIEIEHVDPADQPPQRTGIADLAIGGTFIVGGRVPSVGA